MSVVEVGIVFDIDHLGTVDEAVDHGGDGVDAKDLTTALKGLLLDKMTEASP